jgi:DNA topoisomerase IB
MREVADGLGNTPAVARHSYVDPRVLEAFNRGSSIKTALRRAQAQDNEHQARALIERAVVRLVDQRECGR